MKIDKARFSKKNGKFKYIGIGVCAAVVLVAVFLFVWPGISFWYTWRQDKNAPSLVAVSLDNGETLDLTWTLAKKSQASAANNIYKIELYDNTDKLRAAFKLDGQDLEAAGQMTDVPVQVYKYTEESTEKAEATVSTKSLTLWTYIDDAKTMHLILDAIDTEAVSGESDISEYDFSETASAMQWIKAGVFEGSENIYARVQAVSGNYGSAWLTSNTENLLMGDRSKSQDDSYTIQNARHLFNIRYIEAMTANEITVVGQSDDAKADIERTVTYQQTASVTWDVETYGDFPVIDMLGENSTLSADSDTHIDGLWITRTGAQDSAGLFAVNEGGISGLTLKNVVVDVSNTQSLADVLSGENCQNISDNPTNTDEDQNVVPVRAAGAVCGANYGSITDTKVESGIIFGEDNVGGIAGLWNSTKSAEKLSNGAVVLGKSYVGGIAGKVVNDRKEAVTFKDCSHTGAVGGQKKYVGGIIGYAYGVAFDSDTSAPQTAEQLLQTEAYINLLAGYLKTTDKRAYAVLSANTDYVGGIVGYATGCSITKSNTGEGCVTGHDYVGGIAGYWTSAYGKKMSLEGDGAGNKALVQGHDYVGGIVSLCKKEMTLDHWKNEGYICASGEYAGGITGKNAGILNDCENKMPTDTQNTSHFKAMLDQYASTASYVGGITGLNAGTIVASDKTYVTSVLSGHNYVGGIVGCNLKDAVIKNYALSDGDIWGSYFVGGYAGLNYAGQLLEQETVEASPSLVSGEFAVGGIIGANFSVLVQEDMVVNLVVNNENGEVTSSGLFTGGMIGLNVPLTRLYYTQDITPAEKLIRAVANQREKNASWEDMAAAAVNTFKFMGAMAGRQYHMTITSSNTSTLWDTNGFVKLNRVKGTVYVGGVVGYNHDRMSLTIKNICDMASITATSVITEANDTSYAYAGGITGYLNAMMTLDHCDYDNRVVLTHQGMYKGGLVEVNRGLIRDCDGGVISTDEEQMLGGMAGINLKGGIIHSSVQSGTVTGTAQTGGIAAVNEGVIKNCEVTEVVESSGACVGGIAGINNGTVKACSMTQNVAAKTENTNIYVYTSGNCVGGIVGYNRGTVSECSNSTQTISGQYYVGGIVGYQIGSVLSKASATIERTENKAHVQAYGYAGGIVGAVLGQSSVTGCINSAEIELTQGYLGGVAGYVGTGASLLRCTNNENVKNAQAKYLGGIAGKNAGRIEQCAIGDTVQVSGSQYVGGVAGVNEGTIASISLGTNQISLQGNNNGGYVGGVTGVNEGTVLVCASSADTSKTEVVAQTTVSTNQNGSYIGGVTGQNKGSIQGLTQSSDKSSLNALISVKNDAKVYAGGIAGSNQNTISDYMFAGYIQAPGSPEGAIGGIAGKNQGTISNCLVNDLRMNKVSFSAEKVESSWYYTIRTENAEKANVGGIAGVNAIEGTIENTTLRQCYIRVDYGCVGGLAGINEGTIKNCPAEKTSVTANMTLRYKVKIYVENGYAGGIAGVQKSSGVVRSCSSGIDWTVMAAQSATGSEHKLFEDSAAGGVFGYLYKKSSFRSIRNYAAVLSTDAVDNTIGRTQ